MAAAKDDKETNGNAEKSDVLAAIKLLVEDEDMSKEQLAATFLKMLEDERRKSEGPSSEVVAKLEEKLGEIQASIASSSSGVVDPGEINKQLLQQNQLLLAMLPSVQRAVSLDSLIEKPLPKGTYVVVHHNPQAFGLKPTISIVNEKIASVQGQKLKNAHRHAIVSVWKKADWDKKEKANHEVRVKEYEERMKAKQIG